MDRGGEGARLAPKLKLGPQYYFPGAGASVGRFRVIAAYCSDFRHFAFLSPPP